MDGGRARERGKERGKERGEERGERAEGKKEKEGSEKESEPLHERSFTLFFNWAFKIGSSPNFLDKLGPK